MKFQLNCLDCKHCVYDPECVCVCSLKHWDYFYKQNMGCPDFAFDEEYVRKEFEKMVQRIKCKENILEISKKDCP